MAKVEAIEAAIYYDDIHPDLGSDFSKQYKATRLKISGDPERWSLRPGGYRRVNFEQFPYYLPYLINQNKIYILAVAHEKRAPHYWTSRMKWKG